MPATADWIAEAYPALAARRPFNPSWGLRALVTYDRHLWERVKASSACDRMAMTLSAYNGGLGWVWRDQKLAACKGPTAPLVRPGRALQRGRHAAAFKENRGYPRVILRTFEPRMWPPAGAGELRMIRYLLRCWTSSRRCFHVCPSRSATFRRR
jgi:soluble lytic murein transglycosylase-like protein